MTYVVLVGASLESYGHPEECSEPATGEVTGDSTVSINGTPVACKDLASMEFDSHGHDTDSDDECTDFQSHSINPEGGGLSSTVSIDGKEVYVESSPSGLDPGSGGDIEYTDNGGNGSVTIID